MPRHAPHFIIGSWLNDSAGRQAADCNPRLSSRYLGALAALDRAGHLFTESALEFVLPDGRVARYPKTFFPRRSSNSSPSDVLRDSQLAERWKLLSWLEQLWEGTVSSPSADLEHRTAQQWLESLDVSRTSLQTI